MNEQKAMGKKNHANAYSGYSIKIKVPKIFTAG